MGAPSRDGATDAPTQLSGYTLGTVSTDPETPEDKPEAPSYTFPEPKPKQPKKAQTMKPETAAKKLGILLAAAPAEFTAVPISRAQLDDWSENPPEWLVELRKTGPHPRPVVAGKLGVSTSGLARAGITEPLTTAEISELLQKPPAWLVTERATQAEVRAEQIRVKERDAERAARWAAEGR
jgi:hypothetical protein